MAAGEQTHTIKYVDFLGETRSIILQNLAGSCPLLAICNVLLLRSELNLSPLAKNISQKKLLDMVAHKLNSVTKQNNPQHNSSQVISRLATGIDVNINFKGITEFELTTERVLFDLLNIPLYHGWIVDPQDSKTYNALGSKSYNTILGDLVGLETGFVGIEDERRPEEVSVTRGKLIKNFLATTTSQLTVHGLVCLRKELKEHELCVLFRNNHLSTMFKFGGQLYLLVTDEGYKDQPNVVWEMLNEVNGNTPFMTGNFKEFKAECDYVSNTCAEKNFWNAEYLASTNDAAHDNSSFNSDMQLARDLQEKEFKQPNVYFCSGLVTGPQALIAMGPKKKTEQTRIQDLIATVNESDEEFRAFVVTIPRREEMIQDNFPLTDWKPPTLSWCGKHINTIRSGKWDAEEKWDAGEKGKEWVNAWSNLYLKGVVKPGSEAFLDHSEEDQKKLLMQMLDDINDSRARISYKKWKFALLKNSKRDPSRFRLERGEEEGTNSAKVEVPVEVPVEVHVEVPEVEAPEKEVDIPALDVASVVNEVDDPVELLDLRNAMGFCFIFPISQNRDVVQVYNVPFTLQYWFSLHSSITSRWRPTVSNKLKLGVNWNGDRLKKECLSIMHSVVLAVLDFHHDTGRPHGNLQDHRNLKLYQFIQSVGGNQNVCFRIELLNPLEIEIEDSELLKYFAADMNEVKLILKKILDGKPMHPEMDYLFKNLLDCYPMSGKPWRTQLLRNFTGFWDGKERANFVVLLYYNIKCNMSRKQRTNIEKFINKSYCHSGDSRTFFETYDWVHRIPEGTFFYDVLTYTEPSDKVMPPEPENNPKPQYIDRKRGVGLKYARACLHHNNDSSGRRSSMDVYEIEVCLSNLFNGLILAAYTGMCRYKMFFS